MIEGVCSAPGKLILTGEHSVVYGEPALIGAIGLRTSAVIQRRKDANIAIFSKQLGGCRAETAVSLKEFLKEAKAGWKGSQEQGRSRLLNQLRRDHYVVAKVALGEALEAIGRAVYGLRIRIDSELPLGSGLGSSASVAAAVIGGVGRLYGRSWDLERLNAMVYEAEKIIHGRPSGGDNAAVVFGGILRFQKKKEGGFAFERVKFKKGFTPKILLVDSGRPEETTGEMVETLRSKLKTQNSKVKLIRAIGKVSRQFIRDFSRGVLNTGLIRENERRLEELGVVGERAQRMVRLIEGIGGVAKICGAGGVGRGSGILLAFHHDLGELRDFLKKSRWDFFSVRLGVEGIRWQV